MNRGIKIKAYILLLSWLMIFIHAVVPHNHKDTERMTAEGWSQNYNFQHIASICACSNDEESCNISSQLFYKFQDNFINSDLDNYSKPFTVFSEYYPDDAPGFNTGLFSGLISPRAPPRA